MPTTSSPSSERDRAHAARRTGEGPRVLLVEADGHAAPRRDDQLAGAVGLADPGEFVPVVQPDRDESHAADVAVGRQRGALDHAPARDHHEIAVVHVVLVRPHLDERRHLLVGIHLQEVDDVGAARGAGALADLIALEPEAPALGGEEHDIVVGGADEELLHKVLLPPRHARNAAAAAPLGAVGVDRLPLEVAEVGEGDDAVLDRDEVLDVHLAAHRHDFGATFVGVFLADLAELLLDDRHDAAVVAEDRLVFRHPFKDRGQLLLDLDPLHAGELAHAHRHDSGRLDIGDGEPFDQVLLRVGHVLRVPDDRDDLVGVVADELEALEDMFALLRLAQVVLRAADDDLALKVDVVGEDLLDRHDLGHAAPTAPA